MFKKSARKTLSVVCAIALIISLSVGLTITASAYTPTGTMTTLWNNGSPTSAISGTFYSIGSATELGYFDSYVNGGYNTSGVTFYLTGNITLSGSWTPIGQATISSNASTSSPYVSAGTGFAGTFDGVNYTISGLSVTASSSGAGLFGYLAPAGTIENLTVSGSVSASGSYDAIGVVAGYNSGVINNVAVSSTASVSASSAYNVGGIAGFNDNYYSANAKGVIVNCRNAANITGYSKVGGITGENAGVITSCSNSGTIVGSNTSSKNGVGGIAGRNGNNNTAVETGRIIDCYNTGTVGSSGQKWVGGMAGFANSKSSEVNCYDTGTIVAGAGFYNPIVGNQEGSASYVYSLSGLNHSGSTVPEIGTTMTQAQMQSDTFLNDLNSAASKTTIWARSSGYPYLNYNAAVPTTSTSSNTNSYAVIYLSNTGSDSNDGGSTSTAVATLGKAVAQATLSTNASVYISVMNTITINDEESVFGNGTTVKWAGTSGDMFDVGSSGNLIIGGLTFDGYNGTTNVSTAFGVASSGALTVRNNASIIDCGTAIDVNGSGSLELNRSSIGGTSYSVKLESSSGVFKMYAGSGQTITVSSTVYLASGAYITVGSALSGNLTVLMANPAVGQTVAQRAGSYTFTTTDLSNFQYSGGGHTFARYNLNQAINIAT